MTPRDIEEALGRAARVDPLAPELLDHVRAPILSSITPIRPLPRARVFAAAFLAASGAIAGGFAALAGIRGLPVLMPIDGVIIFSLLVLVAGIAALATAQAMRPGTKNVPGWVVFGLGLAALEAVFALLFHDYGLRRFVPAGMACLRAGLLCAVPAGLSTWLLVRRGFVVAPASTGAAAGVLAGCAGLGMLELHCPILTYPHVAIWHAAVLVVSVGAGAAIGWLVRQKPA